jgi:pimeloyl-ACP methyl ester carboxylesterase
MIDCGTGIPIVLIPGVQGRWEFMRPAVEALSQQCRVITFSLGDEPTSGFAFEESQAIEAYVDQVREAMDRAGLNQAVIAGSSYGGLVASEFAARYPERTLALVLASALPLGWRPDARARFYMRAPRLLVPVFGVMSQVRMLPEISAALPLAARMRFLASTLLQAVRTPLSPARMARRARWTETHVYCDPSRINVPALVITGEEHLDRVVPTVQTRQYVARLRRARHVTLKGTGHLGIVTKPQEFADLVVKFVKDLSNDAQRIPA